MYILYVYSGVLQVSPAARYYFSHKKYCYVYVWKSDVQQFPQPLESDGESHVTDLHVWRVGPGSLVAVISVYSKRPGRNQAYYAGKICKYKAIKHLTISVLH